MHHSGAEEDAAGELSAEEEKAVVPFEETGGDSGDEGTEEYENEAGDLDEDERFGAEVRGRGKAVAGSGVIIVGVTAVGGGGGEEEEEKAEHWEWKMRNMKSILKGGVMLMYINGGEGRGEGRRRV